MGMSNEIITDSSLTLAELVEARLLNLGDIAAAIGVRRESLARYLDGKSRPDPAPARMLAKFIGVTLDALYDAYDRGKAAREAREGKAPAAKAAAKAAT